MQLILCLSCALAYGAHCAAADATGGLQLEQTSAVILLPMQTMRNNLRATAAPAGQQSNDSKPCACPVLPAAIHAAP